MAPSKLVALHLAAALLVVGAAGEPAWPRGLEAAVPACLHGHCRRQLVVTRRATRRRRCRCRSCAAVSAGI